MVKNYHCGDLISPALQGMLEKKLSKLEKYDLAPESAVDIYMSKEGKSGFALKMQLTTKNYTLLSKAVSNDMYKNIDECIDKLSSQISEKKIDKIGKKLPDIQE